MDDNDSSISIDNLNSNNVLLPLTISYDVRFITVDGDESYQGQGQSQGQSQGQNQGQGQDKVIADRQFNEESYYNALREAIVSQTQASENNSQLPQLPPLPPLIRAISWSPSNPNVLTSTYNNGSSKEVKVTKRATELDTVNGIISSSEYRRVTTVAASTSGMNAMGGGIPSISASRILNKWKISDTGIVEGIEIVYSDGALGGDPMSMSMAAAGGGNRPQQQQLSSKCRLRLERK